MDNEAPTRESLLAEMNALRARLAEIEGAAEELARLKRQGAEPPSMGQEYFRLLLDHNPDGVVACAGFT